MSLLDSNKFIITILDVTDWNLNVIFKLENEVIDLKRSAYERRIIIA